MSAILRVTTAMALTGLLALPAFAQEAAPEQPAGEAEDFNALPLGESANEDPQPGQVYIKEDVGDWALQCVRAEEGEEEACQLYQLMRDEQDNPVAEIIVYKVDDDTPAVAGANIVAPLETLLPAGLVMSVDGGEPRKYPFAVCNRVGCVSRIGLTQQDLDAFKRGKQAQLVIRPYGAPQVEVKLPLSLSGFTDGFAKSTVIPKQAPQQMPEQQQ